MNVQWLGLAEILLILLEHFNILLTNLNAMKITTARRGVFSDNGMNNF